MREPSGSEQRKSSARISWKRYSGLFVWRVAREDVVGDANQVLFVSGGEAYEVSEPTRDGYGELIVTPAVPLLSELVRLPDTRLSSHPLFGQVAAFGGGAAARARQG